MTGKKLELDENGDQPVDYMAEAPKARPYSEAITDEHRATLKAYDVIVPEKETE